LASLFGLVADPQVVAERLQTLATPLPAGAAEMASEILGHGAARTGNRLGLGVGLTATALWSAMAAASQLFGALNVIYREQETRRFLRRNLLALLFALGAAAFIVLALSGIVAVSVVVSFWMGIGSSEGQRIQGRSVPLGNLAVALDIEDGRVSIHPVSFGVGKGRIKANIVLTPRNDKSVQTRADIEFQQLDVSRLMGATQTFQGVGTVSGTGTLEATGNSLASMLANGNGGIRLGMTGGDLSSLLINLSGLQFGNALLSALGLPQRAPVECFVADLPVRQGIVTLQALVLDTTEGIVNGAGTVNLRDESLDLRVRTEAKHFSIGSLPTPINIGGTFRQPRIVPGAELAARSGIAAGLAAAFPPLALLPTIQFGTDDDHRCDRLLAEARQKPGDERLPNRGAAKNRR
jgi:hypothetical protein